MTDSDYKLLASQFSALVAGESDGLANASNLVALLYNVLDVSQLARYLFFYLTRETYSRERVSTLMNSF